MIPKTKLDALGITEAQAVKMSASELKELAQTKKEFWSDILTKASEDVKQGMWCTNHAFLEAEMRMERELPNHQLYATLWPSSQYDEGFVDVITIDEALASHRCAEGSLALATALAGGGKDDFAAVLSWVNDALPAMCLVDPGDCNVLHEHNDYHILDYPDRELTVVNHEKAFEAGEHFAEVFIVARDRMMVST